MTEPDDELAFNVGDPPVNVFEATGRLAAGRGRDALGRF
jgi:hypothetical protein